MRLEVRLDGENTWTEIWTRSGDQGADWIDQTIDLSAYAGNTIQLRYRATTGTSWQGDIAIDAFGIAEGGSTADTQAPTAPLNLVSTGVTETTADIAWGASTDNVGVTGYDVYLDGSVLGTVTGTSAQITGLIAATNYNLSVRARDAAGNISAFSNTVNVTTTGGGGGPISDELIGSFFETGLDGWLDGGSDCARYSGRFSAEGSFSMRLRDNSGVASAMTTAASYDLTPYDNIEITFTFYPRSMENGEDFWVRYDDGAGFQTVAAFVSGSDFTNGSFFSATVNIPSSQYNLSSNGRFRIQCDASANGDQVYIDEVIITGTAGASFAGENSIVGLGNGTQSFDGGLSDDNVGFEGDFSIYPNPAAFFADINLALDIEDKAIDVNLDVIDINGKIIISKNYSNTSDEVFNERLNVSSLQAGVYFVRITGSNGMQEMHKLIKR